jgi:hypothetical protein
MAAAARKFFKIFSHRRLDFFRKNQRRRLSRSAYTSNESMVFFISN